MVLYPLDPIRWRWDWIGHTWQLFEDFISGPDTSGQVSMNIELRARGCFPSELVEVLLNWILSFHSSKLCLGLLIQVLDLIWCQVSVFVDSRRARGCVVVSIWLPPPEMN